MTATTMSFNMFEYFHCMTQYIDVLVENHGYDREILTKTWQTENAKWMKKAEDLVVEEKPKKKAAAKKVKVDVADVVAAVMEEPAPKKGKGKGKKETVTPAEVPADDLTNDDVTKCGHMFNSGKSKGTTCTKDAVAGTDRCKTHTKKEKDSKKSDSETETKPKKAAAKKTEEPAEEKPEEPAAAEEKPEEKPEETAEEKPEENKKCKHFFNTGKNKGTYCTHDAVEGTDKCKTHTPKSSKNTPKNTPTTSPKDVTSAVDE